MLVVFHWQCSHKKFSDQSTGAEKESRIQTKTVLKVMTTRAHCPLALMVHLPPGRLGVIEGKEVHTLHLSDRDRHKYNGGEPRSARTRIFGKAKRYRGDYCCLLIITLIST